MGCMSQSAVSVADPSEKKPQGDPSSSSSATATTTARSKFLIDDHERHDRVQMELMYGFNSSF
jgi:hypothetical protein